jgi:hypothetical protein
MPGQPPPGPASIENTNALLSVSTGQQGVFLSAEFTFLNGPINKSNRRQIIAGYFLKGGRNLPI